MSTDLNYIFKGTTGLLHGFLVKHRKSLLYGFEREITNTYFEKGIYLLEKWTVNIPIVKSHFHNQYGIYKLSGNRHQMWSIEDDLWWWCSYNCIAHLCNWKHQYLNVPFKDFCILSHSIMVISLYKFHHHLLPRIAFHSFFFYLSI